MLHPEQQAPQGHTSMASYGRPSLPFASPKPLKPLKALKTLKTFPNRHPKATHPCLLMGVQACRLPALKPLKPLKPLQTLKTLITFTTVMGVQACRLPGLNAANRHPKATHHINGFLLASKPAVCQPLNP